jgi:hypothetical protein
LAVEAAAAVVVAVVKVAGALITGAMAVVRIKLSQHLRST